MRQLTSFLLVALALPAIAAETWRWKDERGVVHYSDRPVAGAQRIDVVPASGAGTDTNTAPTSAPRRAEQPAAPFRYSSCIVAAPANDEVFNAVRSVSVSVQISPGLQSGHRMQVLLDGAVFAGWPAGALGHTLLDLDRGTHRLAVQVLDAGNQSLCTGPTISFHVRQPSILSPARKAAPVKP
ncbi:MAG: DUF4124 domain-containing protein [Steroidobacteraceae bacterium]